MADVTCSLRGCDQPKQPRVGDLCKYHRRRHMAGFSVRPRPTFRERFEAKITRTASCWLWTGAKNSAGYGQIREGGKLLYAHRVAYELHVAQIPEGMVIDHLCRTPACVNPRHLQPVPTRENLARGLAPSAVTNRTGYCQRGHAMTPENSYRRPDGHSTMCRACQEIRERRRPPRQSRRGAA